MLKQQFDAFRYKPWDIQIDIKRGDEEAMQRCGTVGIVLIHVHADIRNIFESMLQAFQKSAWCHVATYLIICVERERCQSMKNVLVGIILAKWLISRPLNDVEDIRSILIMASDRKLAHTGQHRRRSGTAIG